MKRILQSGAIRGLVDVERERRRGDDLDAPVAAAQQVAGADVSVQFEQIGDEGRVLKTLKLVALKKVDDRMIVKSVDLRNEETGDKTEFIVTGAAMGLDLPAGIFEPASLAEAVRPPAADRIKAVAR